jgi:hypothetical protein
MTPAEIAAHNTRANPVLACRRHGAPGAITPITLPRLASARSLADMPRTSHLVALVEVP